MLLAEALLVFALFEATLSLSGQCTVDVEYQSGRMHASLNKDNQLLAQQMQQHRSISPMQKGQLH